MAPFCAVRWHSPREVPLRHPDASTAIMKTLLPIATSLLCPGLARRHPHRLHLRLPSTAEWGPGPRSSRPSRRSAAASQTHPQEGVAIPQPATGWKWPTQQGRHGARAGRCALISEAKQRAWSPHSSQARRPHGAGRLAGRYLCPLRLTASPSSTTSNSSKNPPRA